MPGSDNRIRVQHYVNSTLTFATLTCVGGGCGAASAANADGIVCNAPTDQGETGPCAFSYSYTDNNGGTVSLSFTIAQGTDFVPAFNIIGLGDAVPGAPTVSSVTRQTPAASPTADDSLTWRVTFNEDVQNVNAADFTITGTTATVTNVATVTADTVFDVTVSGGDLANLNAVATLGFAGGQNIQDSVGNALANTTPTGTNDNTYQVLNDTTAPVLAEVTPVPTPSNDTTPSYTFSSDEAGLITVVGDCSLSVATNAAASNNNTITFDTLMAGTHSNCTVTVTDAAGNASSALSVSSFTIIGPATGLAATTGSGQSATISTAFTNPLVATVTDTNGNPVPGVTINFSAPGSGASAALSATSGTTDANGQVSVTATANSTAGGYNITASSAGLADVNFALTNGQGVNTIAFTGPADTDFTVGSVALSATASSGLAVSFASTTPAVCTVSGSTVTFVSVGTCSVTASQAGDANFVAAVDVVQSFAISGDKVVTKTKAIVSNFVSRRAGRILSGTPDIASRLHRGGGVGEQAGFSPVGLSGSGTLDNTKMAFSTSLRQVIGAGNAKKVAQRKELGEMMALGEQSLLSQYNNVLQPGFDVWVKGSLDHAKSDNRKLDLGLLFVGADYHLSETTLVGVLAQFDWSDEVDASNAFKTDGKGWMVGPYLATRLAKNLLFDGRAAYGQSNNHISPLGTYEDSFDTTRWLVSGTLTGDFNLSGWRFSPHVGVSYFEETQKAYTDNIGNNIAAQTVALGRMTFGPEVSTSFTAGNGTLISPHIGLKGIWDFEKAQVIDLNTGLASGADNDLRASIEAGITTQFNNGWLLAGEGHYDGIGDDSLEAYGGSLKLTVPFN